MANSSTGSLLPDISGVPSVNYTSTPSPPGPNYNPPLNTNVPFVGESYQLPPQTETKVAGIPALGSDLLSNLALQTPTQETQAGDLGTIMSPYLNQLANLGPTYGAEMKFLQPYLQPSGSSAAYSMGKALSPGVQAPDEGLPENQQLNKAEANLGNIVSGQQSAGFRDLTKANQQFEQSLPYTSILTTMLQAAKNEILYGSTFPNLTNVNTKQWPAEEKNIYQYLLGSIGDTQSGVPNPKNAGKINSVINLTSSGSPGSAGGSG